MQEVRRLEERSERNGGMMLGLSLMVGLSLMGGMMVGLSGWFGGELTSYGEDRLSQ